VRYVGELIAAVVAESRAQAVDAAEQVFVDYDALHAVVDPEEALTDQTLLFPDFGTNTIVNLEAGQAADFSQCDVVVSQRIINQRIAQIARALFVLRHCLRRKHRKNQTTMPMVIWWI
jgi:carbon-monoxide dehydrogenase large subunit